MKTTTVALLLVTSFFTVGCKQNSGDPAFDAQASAAYRAAWDKRRAGDVEGARALMKDVATKYPNTRAGHRAKDESQPPTKQMVSFTRLITALTNSVTGKADGPDKVDDGDKDDDDDADGGDKANKPE